MDSAKLTKISQSFPLVLRHRRNPDIRDVISQCKVALSDQATFEKDQLGPWIEKQASVDNLVTCLSKRQKVLRSDAAGFIIMQSYPSLQDNPCLEPWHLEEPKSDGKSKARDGDSVSSGN